MNRIYSIYEYIRYDLPRFLKNIWKFRKPLHKHCWYDHDGLLFFMKICLKDMSDNLETKGLEIDESRLKKVEKMRRAITIIDNYNEDNYLELAEEQSNKKFIYKPFEFEPTEDNIELYKLKDSEIASEKEVNTFLIKLSNRIEEEEWNEFIEILRGQDYSKFDKTKDFFKQFDGTGLKTWWD